MDERKFMEIKLLYKGKEMGYIKDNKIVFTNGPDLNPLLDQATNSITEVEDDMGNIIFENKIGLVQHKILFLVNDLGFTIKEVKE